MKRSKEVSGPDIMPTEHAQYKTGIDPAMAWTHPPLTQAEKDYAIGAKLLAQAYWPIKKQEVAS